MRTSSLLAASASVVGSSLCPGQTLTPLAPLPGDAASRASVISGDGRVVAGVSARLREPMRLVTWTDGAAPVDLGVLPGAVEMNPVAASRDGSKVIGDVSLRIDGVRSWSIFVWTADAGLRLLPGLPPSVEFDAGGMTPDGEVIVGAGYFGSDYRAFRLDASGIVNLGSRFPGRASTAHGVSADGRIVAGWNSLTAMYWTKETGIVDIGSLPGQLGSSAVGISPDGRTIVGRAYTPQTSRTFRWNRVDGMVDIAPGQAAQFVDAAATNAATNVIIGSASTPEFDGPFLWTPRLGIVPVAGHLTALGADLTGWRLTAVSAVDASGQRVVGGGTLNGQTRAWLIQLPLSTPCPADHNQDGFVDCFDYIAFVEAYEGGGAAADITADGFLDFFDYDLFVTQFEEGCVA